jgi:predicted component of type VI protein secretion system
MKARLVVEKNRRRVRVILLKPPGATLGRGVDAEVRIPSAEVSRRHCRLRLDDGLVSVEDLESVNGTFLNGEAVKGRQLVRPGDRLEVGPVTFVVEYEPTPAALARLRGEASEEVLDVVEGEPEVSIPRALDDAPLPLAGAEDLPAAKVLADDEPLDLPSGGDLRDLLEGMQDQDTSVPQKPRKDAKDKGKKGERGASAP